MSKKFAISLLSIMSTLFFLLGCDLPGDIDQSKKDDIFDLEQKYMNDSGDYKCLSKQESRTKNSQIKLDANNNINNSYYSRVSNFSNSYNETHSYCNKK
ncbi:DUF5425 family lipoprotein (plasmid) [Borreliella sinica]|uniref:DUF5425 family lipoprotein n=1 Tax=Borreliella sinica TaxID=87162 RepID=UPI002A247926|nr:DUF5425 family lipoprotein [Borreliella sinica]WPM06347.1 DUF5425 family lipoprotein [Borreliella sinica]